MCSLFLRQTDAPKKALYFILKKCSLFLKNSVWGFWGFPSFFLAWGAFYCELSFGLSCKNMCCLLIHVICYASLCGLCEFVLSYASLRHSIKFGSVTSCEFMLINVKL